MKIENLSDAIVKAQNEGAQKSHINYLKKIRTRLQGQALDRMDKFAKNFKAYAVDEFETMGTGRTFGEFLKEGGDSAGIFWECDTRLTVEVYGMSEGYADYFQNSYFNPYLEQVGTTPDIC